MAFSLDTWTTFILLAAISLFVKFLLLLRTRWDFQRALKDFPEHPRGIFFIGHAKAYLDGARGMLSDWEDIYENNEKAIQAWVTPFNAGVIVYHPDTITAVLSTTEPKDWSYRFIYDYLGDGLLISSGKKWARNRRLLSPAFHVNILKPYVKVFVNSSNKLVSKWKSVCKDKACSIEVSMDVGLTALDSLMICIMGVDGDVQSGVEHPYNEAAELLAKHCLYRFSSLPYQSDLIFALSPMGFQNRKALRIAHDYSNKVIAERRQAIEEGQDNNLPGRLMPFMDTLLKAKDEEGQGLTDIEIRNEVDTFMFEGHDTTASGLGWALYNLASNPDIQDRCRKEADGVMDGLENGDDSLKWADLSKFEYLTMFIKESLRHYPPVPAIARRLENAIQLPDGRVIPKGAAAYCHINGVHRNPHVWKEPLMFDPERFSQENSIGRAHNSYLAFAAGPRNCIGQHFVMSELKAVLAVLLRHFRFDVDATKPVQRINNTTLKSTTGIHVIVTLRNNDTTDT